ncbi:response regulator [Rhizobium sp. RM]|uniref:response regulator n=1 Tax=Rhizobium sp. RM TaxID=2748079 RepID=UPI00110F1739|nr:response regulator [Rhizobium sp. RM]NWJ25400.1 response regulator [Rhizobium sp. RM]TMV17520.1 response regulator [Rhizobium sp. Td3]
MHILIIERQPLLTAATRARLESAGATIVGPVRTLAAALECLISARLDAVLIDITVKQLAAIELAQTLTDLDLPFLYVGSNAEAGGYALVDNTAELSRIGLALARLPTPTKH